MSIRRECQRTGLRRDVNRCLDSEVGQRYHFDSIGRKVGNIQNASRLIERDVGGLAADRHRYPERARPCRAGQRGSNGNLPPETFLQQHKSSPNRSTISLHPPQPPAIPGLASAGEMASKPVLEVSRGGEARRLTSQENPAQRTSPHPGRLLSATPEP